MECMIERIVQIKPAYYSWKDQPPNSRQSLGVIAQELEEYFPNIVSTNEEGYKMVNYDALGVLAIQAIKEQHTELVLLRKEIAEIKEVISAIK